MTALSAKNKHAHTGEVWRDCLTGELHELKAYHEVVKFNEIMKRRHNRYSYVGLVGDEV